MRVLLATATVVLAAASPASAARPVTARSLMSLSGVGAIEIGERISTIRSRVGQSVDFRPSQAGGGGCWDGQLHPRALGVLLLGTPYRVQRIDIGRRGVATPSGIRVGDSAARLVAVYGPRLVAVRNFYDRTATNYEYRDGNRKLVFYANRAGTIRSMATGRRPEIDYVEGCA